MRALVASAAAVALVVAFAADGFANPRVKFSDTGGGDGNNASVDGNSFLNGNIGGGGGSGGAGSVDQPGGPGGDGGPGAEVNGTVNFESYNTDIEVITNKELQVAVSNISIGLTGGSGGPGSADTNTGTIECNGDAACSGTINFNPGTPQGGAGGSVQLHTGDVNMAWSCTGFCNVIGNTGIGNANVAETAATFHVTIP